MRKGADPPSFCSSGCCTGHWSWSPVWFLAGPVGHLSADRWQPASYRVPAVPRGTDAGRRSAARSPRSAFVLSGGRSQPDLLDERMSAGFPGGGVTTGSEPAPADAAPGLGRGCARVTGGGCRQVPLPDRHAGSHLQGLRYPEGDVGVVEGDLLICCEPQPRVGRRRRGKHGSAVTSTSGALPARNRPVKVSRGDGSPGRGPAGSPSRRYRGVDRIFLVQHAVFPEPALLGVLPAWPVAEAGKPARLPVAGYRDIQPAPPPVLPAGASPGSTVLPGTMRLPPAAWVTSTRRAWVFGDAGMVTCRTPSA